MDTLTAKFIISTPMFMCGANQSQAEIRAASIKGMVRFWWRALHFAEFTTLPALKEREEELFGSTKKQSSVRFVIDHNKTQWATDNQGTQPTWVQDKKGCAYLGYGVMDFNGELTRPCLQHDSFFTLKLIAKNEIDSSVIDAVKLFGLLGGAGAKSRKGYGSLSLVELHKNGDPISCPMDRGCYIDNLGELLSKTRGFTIQEDTSFSAFSNTSRIDILLSGSNPITILNKYGETMQLYRSWGRDNKLPNGMAAEKNFTDDHKWFKDSSFRSKHPNFHPKRALFGLPHNYYSQSHSASVMPAEYERRASPLFFHVHKLSAKNYLGVSILLPAKFLPDNDDGTNITVNIAGKAKNVPLIENNYQVLTGFLKGKKKDIELQTKKDPYFPERKMIWPKMEGKKS